MNSHLSPSTNETPSAQTPPARASVDECIELAGALEQRRAVAIAEAVRDLPIGGMKEALPTPFHAGYQLACEEIIYRLRTEEWEHCLAPIDAPRTKGGA